MEFVVSITNVDQFCMLTDIKKLEFTPNMSLMIYSYDKSISIPGGNNEVIINRLFSNRSKSTQFTVNNVKVNTKIKIDVQAILDSIPEPDKGKIINYYKKDNHKLIGHVRAQKTELVEFNMRTLRFKTLQSPVVVEYADLDFDIKTYHVPFAIPNIDNIIHYIRPYLAQLGKLKRNNKSDILPIEKIKTERQSWLLGRHLFQSMNIIANNVIYYKSPGHLVASVNINDGEFIYNRPSLIVVDPTYYDAEKAVECINNIIDYTRVKGYLGVVIVDYTLPRFISDDAVKIIENMAINYQPRIDNSQPYMLQDQTILSAIDKLSADASAAL